MYFPHYNLGSVESTCAHVQKLVAAETELNSFLRGYLSFHLKRVGMNLVFLRNQIQGASAWLDIGSFGIEAAVINQEVPDISINALSLEGNLIGIGPEGFTSDPNCETSVLIEAIDVENDVFPYGDNSFDLITCFDVIEHLKFSPIPMIKEIRRVLRPKGRFFLTTPNAVSIGSVRRMLSGWPPQHCPFYHRSIDYGVIHPKEYSIAELSDLFQNLGLNLVDISTFDSRSKTKSERLTAVLCWGLQTLRNLSKKESTRYYRGENIFVEAKKGGPVISEKPVLLFGPE